MNKDLFHPKEDNKKLLGPEVPYYSVISTLIYLANYIRLDIAFLINLLVRYDSTITQRHWNKINHVLQ